MIHRNRIRALARTSVAAFISLILAACSPSTTPTPTAQTPDPQTRVSDVAYRGSALPEVVINASRLPPPRVAQGMYSRPPAKHRGG